MMRPQAEALQAPMPLVPLVDPAVALRKQADKAIGLANPKISPMRRQVVATILTQVSLQIFDTTAKRHLWIAQIGAESGYVGTARSNTGAIGLGQLIPAYAQDFGQACGFPQVLGADLSDDYTNATLSACYFNYLIDKNLGDISLALVAYSRGLNSQDAKLAKQGKTPSKLATDYVDKIKKRANHDH